MPAVGGASASAPPGGSGREARGGAPAKRRARGEAPEEKPMNLEEGLERLEAIAARLEAGTLPLEEALALYREAHELHGRCAARLAEAEREIEILMPDGELRPESETGAAGAPATRGD